MAKLVIIVDVEQMTESAPPTRTLDVENLARRIIVPSASQHSIELVSVSWDGPTTFMRPVDHDERIRQMERFSQYRLGSSKFAAQMFTAYEYPAEAQRIIDGGF